MQHSFDRTDIEILSILQRDASTAVAEIAKAVGLSQSPCWRRIQRLRDCGAIKSQVVLLDRRAFGFNLEVFVQIRFLREQPDPDRGWALAALTGELTFSAAKPAAIRKAVEARMDPVLFGWSYDYVGDRAETVALVWPAVPGLAHHSWSVASRPAGQVRPRRGPGQ